jgi:hypothetical protein
VAVDFWQLPRAGSVISSGFGWREGWEWVVGCLSAVMPDAGTLASMYATVTNSTVALKVGVYSAAGILVATGLSSVTDATSGWHGHFGHTERGNRGG